MKAVKAVLEELVATGLLDRRIDSKGEGWKPSEKLLEKTQHYYLHERVKDLPHEERLSCALVLALSDIGPFTERDAQVLLTFRDMFKLRDVEGKVE
jgi:hypothetical protein